MLNLDCGRQDQKGWERLYHAQSLLHFRQILQAFDVSLPEASEGVRISIMRGRNMSLPLAFSLMFGEQAKNT